MNASTRQVILLAWPIASAMLGETLMGLMDTWLVGHLGAAALGGVGVGNSLIYLCYLTTLGLVRGVKICTAHAAGAGQPQYGRSYVMVGALLGMSCGGVSSLLLLRAEPLMAWVQISPELIPAAMAFLRGRAWGLPAACLLAALVEHRQALGDVRSPMWVGLGGNLVNAVLAYGLIYGHFGLPQLGVEGAGLGTSLAEALQVLGLLAWCRPWRRTGSGPQLAWRPALVELLQVGLPTALHFGCEMLAFVTFSAILGSLGGADVAAHQIAGAINRTAYLFGVAIGEAACILVAQALGAGQLGAADAAVAAASRVASRLMLAVGVAELLFARSLAGLFSDDTQVVNLVVRLLGLAAIWQFLDAFNIVSRAALRGAKDVRAAAILGILIIWGCVPTTAYGLGKVAGWGVVGGWVGFLIGTCIAAVLFTRRWRYGSWRRAYATPAVLPGRQLELAG